MVHGRAEEDDGNNHGEDRDEANVRAALLDPPCLCVCHTSRYRLYKSAIFVPYGCPIRYEQPWCGVRLPGEGYKPEVGAGEDGEEQGTLHERQRRTALRMMGALLSF
jgi:hypothetical protein